MGFLSKLFGDKNKASTAQPTRDGSCRILMSAMLSLVNARFETHRCGQCGATCVTCSSPLSYVGRKSALVLDVGGYCIKCRAYRCGEHATLVADDSREQPGWATAGPDPIGKWMHACGQCGTRLVQNEGVAAKLAHASTARRFPNLAMWTQAVVEERSIDFAAVEKERQALIGELVAKLDQRSIADLAKQAESLRNGIQSHQQYNTHLQALCKQSGVKLERYKLLECYLRYTELAERIDSKALQREMDEFMKTASGSNQA